MQFAVTAYPIPNSLCSVTASEPSSLSNPPTRFSPSSLATLLRTVLTFPRFETIVFAISSLKSSSSGGIEMTAMPPMMSKRFGVRCKSGAGIVPLIWSRRFMSGYVGFLGDKGCVCGIFLVYDNIHYYLGFCFAQIRGIQASA